MPETNRSKLKRTEGVKNKMNSKFWDRLAPIYNLFMSKDHKAYEQMYELILEQVKEQKVLELATGTGLIAKHIADDVQLIEATDFSEKMIENAKKGRTSSKLHFSVQDACNLPYEAASFDVVIISNALHIMPEPKKALAEIRRVLRPDGLLIAPTFTHGKMNAASRLLSKLMGVVGFHTEEKWTSEAYIEFLEQNGWKICRSKIIQASFPLTYVECR